MTTIPTYFQSQPSAPIIGIIGPPGSGKTHAAATIVPGFQEAVTAGKAYSPIRQVPNFVWLQFDRAGTDTLLQYGIQPEVIDMTSTPLSLVNIYDCTLEDLQGKRRAWLSAVSKKLVELRERNKRERLGAIVVDTATAFARAVTLAHLAEGGGLNPKFNGERAYGSANFDIENIINILKSIDCPVLWLLHCRSAYVGDATLSEQIDMKARKPIETTMQPDVQRGVQAVLLNAPSLTVGVKETLNGGKHEHLLVTKPDGIYPVKNRWGVQLPANPTGFKQIWDAVISATANSTNKQ